MLTLFQGIPLPVWEAFWLATSHDSDEYKGAFLSIYELQIVTIGEGAEAFPAVAPITSALPRWVGFSLYVASPSAACLDGCPQTQRPTP